MKSHIGRMVIHAVCMVLFMHTHAQASGIDINIATAYSADSFHTQNLQKYADDIAQSTNGQLTLRIHPNGSLVRPTEITSAVRKGAVEAGEVIMSSLADDCPLCGIDALPFIVSRYEDARRLWDISRDAVGKSLAERGLQLLYAVPWPPQNFYSRNPIVSVRDFQGLRMRSYNPATYRIAELIGAQPVTVQVVDLPKVIAEDGLDLMLTSSWTGVETKAWSKLQYYYKVQAWIPKNIVFMNKRIFDELDAPARNALIEAAVIAERRGWNQSQETDKLYEEELALNMRIVSEIDPLVREYLDRIGESLALEWLRQADGDEFKILLKYTTERSMK